MANRRMAAFAQAYLQYMLGQRAADAQVGRQMEVASYNDQLRRGADIENDDRTRGTQEYIQQLTDQLTRGRSGTEAATNLMGSITGAKTPEEVPDFTSAFQQRLAFAPNKPIQSLYEVTGLQDAIGSRRAQILADQQVTADREVATDRGKQKNRADFEVINDPMVGPQGTPVRSPYLFKDRPAEPYAVPDSANRVNVNNYASTLVDTVNYDPVTGLPRNTQRVVDMRNPGLQEFDPALSQPERDDIAAWIDQDQMLAEMETLTKRNPLIMGPLASAVTGMAGKFTEAINAETQQPGAGRAAVENFLGQKITPDVWQMMQLYGRYRNGVFREAIGSQRTGAEMVDVKTFLPNITDQPDRALAAIKGSRQAAIRALNRYRRPNDQRPVEIGQDSVLSPQRPQMPPGFQSTAPGGSVRERIRNRGGVN